jgi:hypothetical protein
MPPIKSLCPKLFFNFLELSLGQRELLVTFFGIILKLAFFQAPAF